MLWLGLRLARQERRVWHLSLGGLATNLVLTVTDVFGLFDFVALLLALSLVLLLLASRGSFTA